MDDDDFGDFAASLAPEVATFDATFDTFPADPVTTIVADIGDFPQPIGKDEGDWNPPAALMPEAQEDEDNFCDFSEAPTHVAAPVLAPAPAHAPPAPPAADDDDDFGDFGEAEATPTPAPAPNPSPVVPYSSYHIEDDLVVERSSEDFLTAVEVFLERGLGEVGTPGGWTKRIDNGNGDFGASVANDAGVKLARIAQRLALQGDGGDSVHLAAALEMCAAGWPPAISIGLAPSDAATQTALAPKPWVASAARLELAAALSGANKKRDTASDVVREAEDIDYTCTMETNTVAVESIDVAQKEVIDTTNVTEKELVANEALESVPQDSSESADGDNKVAEPETLTSLFDGIDFTASVPVPVVVETLEAEPEFARFNVDELENDAGPVLVEAPDVAPPAPFSDDDFGDFGEAETPPPSVPFATFGDDNTHVTEQEESRPAESPFAFDETSSSTPDAGFFSAPTGALEEEVLEPNSTHSTPAPTPALDDDFGSFNAVPAPKDEADGDGFGDFGTAGEPEPEPAPAPEPTPELTPEPEPEPSASTCAADDFADLFGPVTDTRSIAFDTKEMIDPQVVPVSTVPIPETEPNVETISVETCAPTELELTPVPPPEPALQNLDSFSDIFGPVVDTKPLQFDVSMGAGTPLGMASYPTSLAFGAFEVSPALEMKQPDVGHAPDVEIAVDAFGEFETSPAPAGEMDFDFAGFGGAPVPSPPTVDPLADFFGEAVVATPPVMSSVTDEDNFGGFQ